MLLSGRIVPLALLPDWAERLSWLLPFRWTFGFPITALVGPIDSAELIGGLGMQLLWIVIFGARRPRLLAGERAALRGGRRMRAPGPLAGGRLALLFLRVSVMNDLQYRANFAIQLFQSLLALGTGLAVLALIFDQTNELGGWSQTQLIAVMGIFTIMGGVIRSLIEPNMQRLMEDVRKGTLDYVLTKPEDPQLLVSVRDIRMWQGVEVLTGAIVLVYAVVPDSPSP